MPRFSLLPYTQRLLTNLAGVLVGYLPILVALCLGETAELTDWGYAMVGAMLIPVISRLVGASKRANATPWFLTIVSFSTTMFLVLAGVGLVILGKTRNHNPCAAEILQNVSNAWYLWIALGLIVDLMMVAAEEEGNDKPVGKFLHDLLGSLLRRHRP